jgi:hypothetical protein
MVLLARQTSKQAHRRCCAERMLKQALVVGFSAASGCLSGLLAGQRQTAVGLELQLQLLASSTCRAVKSVGQRC